MNPKTQNIIQYSALTLFVITCIQLLNVENGWCKPYAILIGLIIELGVVALVLGGILKLILKKKTSFLTNICIITVVALITFQVYFLTSILN